MIDAKLINIVRAALAEAGDPDRAAGQQSYMKSAMPFHGLRSPELHAILRPILAEHRLTGKSVWMATVQEMFDSATHREERYAAIALARHRFHRSWQGADCLPLYRHLISTGARWDIVDDVASHLVCPIVVGDSATHAVMRQWAIADDLWVRRAAILCQLGAGERTDLALLGDCLDANLDRSPYGDDFFIRKAVGWALRQYARIAPDWVRAYVESNELSPLSKREALKHLN